MRSTVTACILFLVMAALSPVANAAPVFNVRDYGATGNGSSNDTGAINRAITAANAAGGGTVQFPSGTYKSGNTIHLKSNVTIQLDSGATIMGSGDDNYDPPEPNQWDEYQDYGHSHFHNAMIRGDRLSNIAFTGSGTIDGGGHLITGNPRSGEADKIISLTRCSDLRVDGIKLRRGGHFAMLINGCTNVTSDRLVIDTASDRYGWNIISTTNVRITNGNFAANDDALAFKSDYALGAKLANGNVTVTDTRLAAVCCNALMFGSETCGDFTGYRFSRIAINGSNKSGLGMVSMDGARISDVHYSDITMTGVRSPIMQKVGTRKRCGNNPGVGSISNVTYTNITATGASPSFSPTLWGDAAGRISDVTFDNVNIRVPGGNGTMSTAVPSNEPTNYNPNSIGTRPAYGWYIRYVNGVKFRNSSVRFASNDGRPAVIVNNSANVSFVDFIAQRGSSSPFDFGYQSSSGHCVTNVRDTNNNAIRFDPGTPPSCTPSDELAITGLTVTDSANAADWSLQRNLATGAAQYGDRTFTFTTVPAALAGAQWIRTANDSKAASANPLVSFTVNRAATVSVAVDTRVGRPSWMDSTWTDTGASLVNSEGTPKTFRVFERAYPAGAVALGPNANSGSSMYTVIVR